MSNFDTIINRRGTYCTQWDYIKDRFGQSDLLPFTISDMDIPTAPRIIQKIETRLSNQIFGYTRWNHSDYKGAIKHWYQQQFNYFINDDWIAYSPNVIYGVVKFFELFNPKKEAISFITPCYDGFMKILKSNNYPLMPIHQHLNNNEFYLDWEEFEQKISQSKIFLLCNPNNPNGYLWTKEDLIKIVTICKRHHVAIISDDIHMDFVYKPSQFTPILTVAQELDYMDNTIIITSHSKTFNLSGIGGAYLICPNNNLLTQYLDILNNGDSLGSAPSLHVETLITGYTECSSWVNDLTLYIHNNFLFTKEYLHQHLPSINFNPQSTYFAWMDCRNLELPMSEIQDRLINKGKVAIMDGDRYQEPTPFLRMVQGCPLSKVQDGLERMVNSLK